MIILSEIESDTLAELLNLGMGRAAASLSQMVGEEISLSVPHLEFLTREEATRTLEVQTSVQVSAVVQPFSGPFSGSSMLIFPQSKSLELVRVLLKSDAPVEVLTELEQEALSEVGNVILNACLGTLANMLRTEIRCGLPEFISAQCSALMGGMITGNVDPARPNQPDDPVILIIVDFATQSSHVKGYVVLMVDISTLSNLKNHLNDLLRRYQAGGSC